MAFSIVHEESAAAVALGEPMKSIKDAVVEVKAGVRRGLRGPGCAAIHLADGRLLTLDPGTCQGSTDLLLSVSDNGEMIRYEVEQLAGAAVEAVTWSTDEGGALLC